MGKEFKNYEVVISYQASAIMTVRAGSPDEAKCEAIIALNDGEYVDVIDRETIRFDLVQKL
jgi:hypothetical protein